MIFLLQICILLTPSNNPLFKKQFYIQNDGTVFNGLPNEDLNVVPAWEKGSTGEGVHIVIINDGCQADHKELVDNFDFNLSFNYETNTSDPSYDKRQFVLNTGTKLATIAAGSDNDICGIGIAYKSKISCINALTTTKAQLKYQEAIKRDSEIKKSIRLFPSFSQYLNGNNYIVSFDEDEEKFFENTESIYITYVQSGNVQTNEDYSYLFYPGNPHIFTFSEISQRGGRTSSTIHGNVVLASVVTGGGDYDSNVALLSAYISTGDGFGQICSETILPSFTGSAMATGVVSLILSSTDEPLKSNDISVIIALTSVKNDPYSNSWKTNKKGIRYSSVYGFGRLDADAAVTMAKSYRHKEKVEPETAEFISNNGNELPITFPSFLSGFVDVKMKLENSKINYIDFVELIMEFSKEASDYSMLRIFIISPSGTERQVKDVASIVEPAVHKYRIAARDFFGEEASGIWTVRFLRENVGSPNYKLESISLKVTGYEDTDFPQQTDKSGSNPFQTYKTVDANLVIQSQQQNQTEPIKIQCNQLFNFNVETSDQDGRKKYSDVPFDLMLTKSDDDGPFERFGTGLANKPNPAAVYCMYKEGSYNLRAVNPAYQVSTNDVKVELINPGDDDYSDTGFGEVQQYRTIPLTFSKLGYTLIPINIIRSVRRTLSNYKNGYLTLATLWNIETGETYGTQLAQSIGGQYVYTGNRQCEKCVLTVVPFEVDEPVGSQCNTFVNTLSIVDTQKLNGSENSKFEIEWNGICPVPKGILTHDEPTSSFQPISESDSYFSNSQSFSQTNSFPPSKKPSNNKLSTKIILIIVSAVIIVILLIVITICLIKRKKSSTVNTIDTYSTTLLDSKNI